MLPNCFRQLRTLITTLALATCSAIPASAQNTPAAVEWDVRTKNGNQYVTANGIKKFYGFAALANNGNSITLTSKKYAVKLQMGSQDCYMNNVKFILSFPVTSEGNEILISRLDLSKVIDPVLRPNIIRTMHNFNTVILDPGHGGKDQGATNGLGTEAYYNLRIARKLKSILELRGFKVALTRNNDVFLSLQQRVDIANRFTNAIFVSIHHNSAGGRAAEGIETFTLSPQGTAHYGRGVKASDANKLVGNNQDGANIALATAVHSTCQRSTKAFDRGIKRARFSVLTNIRHPAILLEVGFMSNARDARRIHDNRFQDVVSTSMANAIGNFRAALNKK